MATSPLSFFAFSQPAFSCAQQNDPTTSPTDSIFEADSLLDYKLKLDFILRARLRSCSGSNDIFHYILHSFPKDKINPYSSATLAFVRAASLTAIEPDRKILKEFIKEFDKEFIDRRAISRALAFRL